MPGSLASGARLLSCGHDGKVVLDQQTRQVSHSKLLSLAIFDQHVAVGSEAPNSQHGSAKACQDGHIYLLNDDLQTLDRLKPFGECPINGLAALPGAP